MPIQDNPLMDMIADTLGESRTLTVTPQPDEVVHGVVVLYPLPLLVDNRTGIQVLRHIVTGCSN